MGTNLIDYNKLLLQREFNKDIVPSAEVICLKIEDKIIGTIGNYVVYSGLPKPAKVFYCSYHSQFIFTPDLTNFGIKLTTFPGRPKIAYFDTESSQYDNYQQIQKICKLGLKTTLPENIKAYNTKRGQPRSYFKTN